MRDDSLMRRVRAARPLAAEPGDHAALFAQIVAEPGDPRLVEAPHKRSSRPPGRKVRPWTRARPRLLAGSTLGLAGVGAVLVLALSAGGAAAPPAFAITRSGDGSVTVQINRVSSLVNANRKLVALGVHEQIGIAMAPGAASESGPVDCTLAPGVSNLPGPPLKVLVGTDGTDVIAAGNTGAGTWHLASCGVYPGNTSLSTLRGYGYQPHHGRRVSG
jgi:hypothetical protein